MVKIWAKVMKDNRIQKQTLFEADGRIEWSKFHEYMAEICYRLDIPTPVVIKVHLFNLAKFNHVKFTKGDFVEKIDFDNLFVENLSGQ